MNNEEIKSFIRQNKGAEIAVLQQKFDITFKEAKTFIEELVSKGELVFVGGLKYNYIEKRPKIQRHRSNVGSDPQGGDKYDTEREIDSKLFAIRHRALFEERRLERMRKMQEDTKDDDDEDEEDYEDNDISDLDSESNDEIELKKKALELCIKNNNASVSFLQRTMPIGYIKACKFIDWMEEQKYISAPCGVQPRKILITEEEFNKKFRPHLFLFDDDDEVDDDDEDDKDTFESLERFQEEQLKMSENERKEFLEFQEKIQSNPKIEENIFPTHYLWDSEFEFIRTVRRKKVEIVKSDKNMGVKGAIKRAQALLEETKNNGDAKFAEVYERLIYEFKNTTPYEYTKLKRQYF